MIEPWFDPNHYGWIPGTAYGVAAGMMGGLAGWLAPRGRAGKFILRAWFTLWTAALALLIAGIVALANGQPWGVWYGLLLPGGLGTLVVGPNFVLILKTSREVEARRLTARDLL